MNRAREPGSGWTRRIRLVGALLLLLLAMFVWLEAPWAERMQSAWFDLHQTLRPRQPPIDLPVTIVAIDHKSLLEVGQWPWPRRELARLVRAINGAQPAAIGINILMPESDALSPERLLAQNRVEQALLADALRALPTHDAQLSQAMAAAPAVLVIAGTREPTRQPLRATPITVHDLSAGAQAAEPAVPLHAGALVSIDEIDAQASGRGLFSADPTRGVIRRMPTVASIDGTLVPSLAIEMLRVAQRVPSLKLSVFGSDVAGVTVGRLRVPTEGDGTVRVYFSPHLAKRFVSAADVLEGRIDLSPMRDHLVLIGLTAIGLQDELNTPIGERMSGSEIHAQLMENLVDGSWLHRAPWAPSLEAALLLLLGAALVWATPRWRPFSTAALLLGCLLLTVLGSTLAFRSQRLLFDAVTPGLSLLLLYLVLLLMTLAEATRQSRALRRVVQAQREDSARISGELLAAQRVQTAALPRADLLQADRRVELYATLRPAREVGGDLYDYFLLDERRLFLLIGDVAGKGLSASIFMAVSKALYKSAMLRAPQADIGTIMVMANAEVSRDNAENLFVTAFAAILDLDSGELHYCNAGHDNPYRLNAGDAEPKRIADGDGPPLCAVSDYDYRGASLRLQPGETLVLMTDGVTEAQDSAGALYGNERVQRLLLEQQRRDTAPMAIVQALNAGVQAFAGDAEAADDLTILVLRWNGPR